MGTLRVLQERYAGAALLLLHIVSRSQGKISLIRLYTPGTIYHIETTEIRDTILNSQTHVISLKIDCNSQLGSAHPYPQLTNPTNTSSSPVGCDPVRTRAPPESP